VTYKTQFTSDYKDDTLPEGYMRNASGQQVRVNWCYQLAANDIDCICKELSYE